MATVEDILKKSRINESKKFQPVHRRAWDYLNQLDQQEMPTLNREQIYEQNGNEKGIINGNNREQIYEQNGNKYRNEFSNDSKTEDYSKSNSEDIIQKQLIMLTGHQKEIMRHVISHIKNRVGLPYVFDILPSILAIKIKATVEVTRVSLKRLVEKKILVKLPGERGRNGYCKFKIHEFVIKICFKMFNDLPADINAIEVDNTNKNGNNLTDSSSINIKTTTMLPENWEQINTLPLSMIGFSKTQLSQLFENNFNAPDVIQESIHHFAFGLQYNEKLKKYSDPLNVLMGVLRKGQAWIENNYEPAEHIAIRQVIEQKKKQQSKKEAMINELVELEFPEWEMSLPKDQLESIVPEEVRKMNMKAAITSALKKYFIENILIPKLAQI